MKKQASGKMRSPALFLVIGLLWLVTAAVLCLEKGGFSPPVLLLLLAAAIFFGLAGYWYYRQKKG